MPVAADAVERASRSSASRVGLGALMVVTLLAFAMRLPSIAEPLGIDQGLFASAARAMSRGAVLYRDVWDQKPPAIFLTYRAAFGVFGWTPAAISWLDILASAATTWLLFSIGRRLADTTVGVTAAALYAALTIPSWLSRYGGFLERSVAETFVALAIAAAARAAIELRGTSPSNVVAALAGLAAGAAVAFKPNAALYAPAILVWTALYRERGSRWWPALAAAIAGAALFPLLTVAWIAASGALADARVALIDFNRFYVSQSLEGRHLFRDFANAIGFRVKFDPLWGSAAIGVLLLLWNLARTRRLQPLPALTVAWGGAAALVILINGAWLFNTYFLQALPPLALLAGWTMAGLRRRHRVEQLAAIVAIVVMLLPLVRKNYPAKVFEVAAADFRHWRGRDDPAQYLERFGDYGTGRGYSARANAELAAYIRSRTNETDRLYQFGINSAEVYFATDRLPAQRFLRVNEFVPATFPAPGFDLASVAHELAERRPVYLIFETLHTGTPMANAVDHLQQAPELQPLLRLYQREAQVEDFTLYRRRRDF